MSRDKPYQYHAYLLRLWQEGQDAPWRAMVEDTGNGRKQAFPTLRHLIMFLEAKTGEPLLSTQAQGDE